MPAHLEKGQIAEVGFNEAAGVDPADAEEVALNHRADLLLQ